MKSFLFLFFLSLLYGKFVDLTEKTFDDFIDKTAAIVEFYSPGCKNCLAFAPAYEDLMNTVAEKHLPYAVARINILENKNLADKYAVGKLPILRFFYKDKNYPYYGAMDGRYLLEFIEQLYKNIEPLVEIKNEEELKKRSEVKVLAAILVGGSKEDIEVVEKLPKKFSSMWFFHTSAELAQKVFPDVKSSPSIVLIKETKEDKSVYTGPIEEKAIESFLNTYSRAKVSELNQEVINNLFKNTGKKGVLLLREANEEGKKVQKILEELADKHRSEDLIFVVTDIESELGKRVGKMLSITKANLPHMEIVETKKKLERTKFEGSFTLEDMDKFIEDWKSTNKQKIDL